MVNEKKLVWKYFKSLSIPNNKTKKVECKFCYKQYTANATRMIQHISVACVKCPNEIRQTVGTQREGQGFPNKTVSSVNSAPSCSSTASTSYVADEPDEVDVQDVHAHKSLQSQDDQGTGATTIDVTMSQSPRSGFRSDSSSKVSKGKKQPKFNRIDRFCDSISPRDQVFIDKFFFFNHLVN